MNAQQPMVHVPGRGGLWTSVRLPGSDRVDDQAWRHHAATLQHVGTCRQPDCGQPLAPVERTQASRNAVVQYLARCTACGHEVVGQGPAPKAKRKRGRR